MSQQELAEFNEQYMWSLIYMAIACGIMAVGTLVWCLGFTACRCCSASCCPRCCRRGATFCCPGGDLKRKKYSFWIKLFVLAISILLWCVTLSLVSTAGTMNPQVSEGSNEVVTVVVNTSSWAANGISKAVHLSTMLSPKLLAAAGMDGNTLYDQLLTLEGIVKQVNGVADTASYYVETGNYYREILVFVSLAFGVLALIVGLLGVCCKVWHVGYCFAYTIFVTLFIAWISAAIHVPLSYVTTDVCIYADAYFKQPVGPSFLLSCLENGSFVPALESLNVNALNEVQQLNSTLMKLQLTPLQIPPQQENQTVFNYSVTVFLFLNDTANTASQTLQDCNKTVVCDEQLVTEANSLLFQIQVLSSIGVVLLELFNCLYYRYMLKQLLESFCVTTVSATTGMAVSAVGMGLLLMPALWFGMWAFNIIGVPHKRLEDEDEPGGCRVAPSPQVADVQLEDGIHPVSAEPADGGTGLLDRVDESEFYTEDRTIH